MNELADKSPLPVPDGFDELPVTDKLLFLAQLWERTEVSPDASTLHDRVVGEVAGARLAELKATPELAISREEVMRRVRERLSR
ncbi:MAG: hypothetical protein ACJAYU_004763 [Bradymonadia bacterium]|jgi:hypothetical protein